MEKSVYEWLEVIKSPTREVILDKCSKEVLYTYCSSLEDALIIILVN